MHLRDVWFKYAHRGNWVLRAVDMPIEPGRVTVVLGRNGVGKSTLLQLAAGILKPVRGAVQDRPAVIGWVPERFPADQPFTARGYLRHMAALRGGADVEPWIDRLGLRPYADVRLPELSKGTAQKVGLAQALIHRPGLLILDEPWEGLDAQARTTVPDLVADVTAAGGAVLVSDHRGEIAGLRDTVRFSVTDGEIHADVAELPSAEVVIEIGVGVADADRTVTELRADGYRVLGVRR